MIQARLTILIKKRLRTAAEKSKTSPIKNKASFQVIMWKGIEELEVAWYNRGRKGREVQVVSEKVQTAVDGHSTRPSRTVPLCPTASYVSRCL